MVKVFLLDAQQEHQACHATGNRHEVDHGGYQVISAQPEIEERTPQAVRRTPQRQCNDREDRQLAEPMTG